MTYQGHIESSQFSSTSSEVAVEEAIGDHQLVAEIHVYYQSLHRKEAAEVNYVGISYLGKRNTKELAHIGISIV